MLVLCNCTLFSSVVNFFGNSSWIMGLGLHNNLFDNSRECDSSIAIYISTKNVIGRFDCIVLHYQ